MSIISQAKTSHVTTTEYVIKPDVIKTMIATDLGIDPATMELIWDIDSGVDYDGTYCGPAKVRSLKIKVTNQ